MKTIENLLIRAGEPGCSHPASRRVVMAENRGAGCLTVSVVCLDCDAKQRVAVTHNDGPGDEGRATEVARQAAW